MDRKRRRIRSIYVNGKKVTFDFSVGDTVEQDSRFGTVYAVRDGVVFVQWKGRVRRLTKRGHVFVDVVSGCFPTELTLVEEAV